MLDLEDGHLTKFPLKEKMKMDKTLAELYGTAEATEADLEKMAAAELAENLADEGGMSLDGLDEDELEALAAEVLGAEEEETEEAEVEKEAEAEETEEETEEEETEEDVDEATKVAFAEADYAGRIMAHAFHQESREIEKNAGVGASIKGFGSKVHNKVTRLGAKIQGNKRLKAHAADVAKKSQKKKYDQARAKGMKPSEMKEWWGAAKKDSKVRGGQSAKRRAAITGYGAVGGGAAAVAGGAGLAAHALRKEKKSSAFETLAEQRAQEILAELNEGQGNRYDVLAEAVEARAMEMLGLTNEE